MQLITPILAALLAAPAAERVKVALLPIEQTGVEAHIIPSLTAVLGVELEKTGAFEVLAQSDLSAMLEIERQRDALGCVESCLVDLGASLGVDRFVRTHVGRLGETYILELSILNARTARSEGRAYEAVRGGPEKLLELAAVAVRKLPRPSPTLDRALSPGAQLEAPASAWGARPAWLTAGAGVAAIIVGGVLRARGGHEVAGNAVLGLGASSVLVGLLWAGSSAEGPPP